MKRISSSGLAAGLAALVAGAAMAQGASPPAGPRQVPAKTLPTPTDVSPQMRAIIERPYSPTFNQVPKTVDEWAARGQATATAGAEGAKALATRLKVTVEPAVVDGVPVFVVRPAVIRPENKNRVLIQAHGGCYVFNGGIAATSEAVLMAHFGGYLVISVDYRMPPKAYFPAALDDVVTVYKHAAKDHGASHVGILGTSAGGALVLETVLRAKQLGLPLPGAVASGTPMADITGVGDSFVTNAMVDNVLVSPDGACDPAAKFYANGHDLKDPLLSPVYGDFAKFPPTILTTGTRDLLLSNTVRVHRKLRQAGVEADLNVYEAQSHAQYSRDETAPETKEAFGDIAAFFDKHLAK